MGAAPSDIYLATGGGTSISTGAGLLNNKRVYLLHNILTKKLGVKIEIISNTSIDALTRAIRILPKVNKNKRRIHWILIKEP